MKANRVIRFYGIFLCLFTAITGNCFAANGSTTNEDLSAVGKSVIKLLETRDASKFADELAPSLGDWRKASAKANDAEAKGHVSNSDKNYFEYQRKNLAAGAENFLQKATQLGIDPEHVRFQIIEIPATPSGTLHNAAFQAEGESLPWKSELTLVLSGEPAGAETNKALSGAYQVSLSGLIKFPDGWRCQEGIRWKQFPDSVADEKTKREMKILSVVEKRKPLHSEEDPAVDELAKAMLKFLQTRDEKAFAGDAMLDLDEIWERMKNESVKRNSPLPPRNEFDKQYASFTRKTLQSARQILATATRLDLDFSNATITDATVDQVYNRGPAGTVDQLTANSFTFTFNLPSDEKSKSGHSIGGDYVLKSGEVLRMNNHWRIQGPIRWAKFPAGVVDTNEAAKIAFENYVAENGALPPGSMAPEIEFIRLDNDASAKLSDYRGKVLVLDFWATWCGPCQEPMADLQKLVKENPAWKDRVKIMSLSIDDKAETVKAHLQKRGWTNTFNLWAGEGAWEAKAPRTYRVRGVPTTYIIDQNGKILQSGHPVTLQFKQVIDAALKRPVAAVDAE